MVLYGFKQRTIFAISGIGCFHITYYTDTIPYWITHTLWHIFIMTSAFYFLRVHVVTEIKEIGNNALRRVSSIENFIRSRMTNNMEMHNLQTRKMGQMGYYLLRIYDIKFLNK